MASVTDIKRTHQESLKDLFIKYSGNEPEQITMLPASGSDRSYYRITSKEETFIGTCNEVLKENNAFIYFTSHFNEKGLPVPEVLAVSDDKKVYLQTDLGDDNLFSILSSQGISAEVKELYHQAVQWLPAFQTKGIKGLNLEYCYPRRSFDKQSMMWDFNYFKYYFARLSGITFDEQALEDDFETLATFLQEAESDYFMFRDFQSRNIMINDGKTFFIDYQGGRSGPLQYDLASLLFDAKANLPQWFRDELLEKYLENLDKNDTGVTREKFLKYFDGFVLIRILQALGAYGFRGYYQKKQHFLQSIPYALDNLKYLFLKGTMNVNIPEIKQLLEKCMVNESIRSLAPGKLTVRITSFSYKNGIPQDKTGNGGGFVFDCRALPNPGRYAEYQQQSGLDEPVIKYLAGYPELGLFLDNVFNLVDQAVKNYQDRGFQNLMVSFGCTGGRHRSVYCATMLVKHLNEKFGLDIKPEHTERENW